MLIARSLEVGVVFSYKQVRSLAVAKTKNSDLRGSNQSKGTQTSKLFTGSPCIFLYSERHNEPILGRFEFVFYKEGIR